MAWVDRNMYRLHCVGEAGRVHDGQFRQPQLAQQHRQRLRRQQGSHQPRTVGRYIFYLRDAFVFYEAKRYDIKGKKYITTRRGFLAELP